MTADTEHVTTARIEADATVPMIRMTRDFRATPEQVRRAHLDPEIFAQWIGPASGTTRILRWDARTGWTRLHVTSLVDSFEGRDHWLASGMETGVNDGYAALDRMLEDGAL